MSLHVSSRTVFPLRRGRLRPGMAAFGLLILGATATADAMTGSAPPIGMHGFASRNMPAEAELEARFDANLSADEMRAWMEQLASAPNHVGSPHDAANAEFLLGKFREWGWDASIETFSVLYPTPREVSLELVAPTHFSAKLLEPPVQGDATSSQLERELPPYNVYGADGDVTAELIYVNQGMPDDYEELARLGLSVEGRIVLTRYGGGWRGLKPKLAYEHGAVGCIIYSDPRDDGYFQGDTYPAGGYRPRDGVQRGSVLDLTLYSGDPLTPGIGATARAKRLSVLEAKTVLKIPVLPISYADAEPLLAALGGPVVPSGWRGALPLTYHAGPGPATVHLKVISDWTQKKLYDVIAKIRGSVEPERWIIRGNHHDAWVFGAADPFSGHVALMGEAKAIGVLLKQGWRPRRTLVYASWDGEEPGLLGSTEWVETHAVELKSKGALYINSDMNSRGTLDAEGSPALQSFVSQAARDVNDPETGTSVLARAVAARRVASNESGAPVDDNADVVLSSLGSGSDYTPFLQHLGVNSLNLEFHGEAEYGVYHSAYDSFDHFRRFVDPSFAYGVALAKVAGRIVLRAAQADILPAQEVDFANSIAGMNEELHKLVDTMRAKTQASIRLLGEDAYHLAANPAHPRASPARPDEVPPVNFDELDSAIERLRSSAKIFDQAYARSLSTDDAQSRAVRVRMSDAVAGLEGTLTDRAGLPGRVWYQHMIYAPGLHTGYGVKTMPGIREALEDRRWDDANRYIGVVARVLNAYSARLDGALPAR